MDAYEEGCNQDSGLNDAPPKKPVRPAFGHEDLADRRMNGLCQPDRSKNLKDANALDPFSSKDGAIIGSATTPRPANAGKLISPISMQLRI